MPKVTVKDPSGADKGSVELDELYFGIEPNLPVLHQVVTAQLAARRAGTQSTKTRAEVRGGGAKPWKQKGTGRARQGSIRAPQWKGGGVALGPKPRSYAQRTPKKMIKLALRSALSDRANELRRPPQRILLTPRGVVELDHDESRNGQGAELARAELRSRPGSRH